MNTLKIADALENFRVDNSSYQDEIVANVAATSDHVNARNHPLAFSRQELESKIGNAKRSASTESSFYYRKRPDGTRPLKEVQTHQHSKENRRERASNNTRRCDDPGKASTCIPRYPTSSDSKMQEDTEIAMLRRRVKVNHTDFNLEYDLGGTIGQGTFGKVKKATDKQRFEVVAVKMLGGRNFGTNELRAFLNECDILAEIDHSNVPKLHGIYECNRKYTMIMEYASGGELFERIQAQGSFNEEAAANITRQLLSVLQYIHDKRIAHRDLKPENILFADCERDLAKATVKLIDFGFAKRMAPGSGAPEVSKPVITQNSFQTRLGSPNYVAPEILTSKIGYGVEVDVWSLGVILYIMLCGYFPFYHENERELYRQIRKGSFDMPSEDWSHVSDAAKDLVNSMLKTDPRLRASASDCLRHPWIAKPGVASKQPFPQASRDKLDIFLDSQKKSTKLKKVMDKVFNPFRHSPKKSEQVAHGHVQNKSNLEMSQKMPSASSKGKDQPRSSSGEGAESQESITSPLYSQYGITHSALPKKTGCAGNCVIQ